MNSRRLFLPALLLLTWCGSAPGADSTTGAPPVTAEDRAQFQELLGPAASTDAPAAAEGALDRQELLTRIAELRARSAAGDPKAAGEIQVLFAALNRGSSKTIYRGTMNSDEARAKLAELRARAAAGDPTVKQETHVRMTDHGEETTTTFRTTLMTGPAIRDPEEARAKLEELRARAAAGDPTVTFTQRSKSASRTVEMTDAERTRRQAYVASHPDLPARTKETILAGLFVLAMKFEDVEQLLGPLQSAEGRLPEGVVLNADVKAYTAQQNGKTVYLLFRDGKLVRR